MKSAVFVFIYSTSTDFSLVGAWDIKGKGKQRKSLKEKGKQRKSLKEKTGDKTWKPYDFELRRQAVPAFPVCPVDFQIF
jgi:hypothetical protein